MTRRLIEALAALVLLPGAALAAPPGLSTTLEIAGRISARCALALQVDPQAMMLDIAGGATDVAVARITETCNNAAGYRIALASRNQGVLRSGVAGDGPLDYQVRYDQVFATHGQVQNVLRDGRAMAPRTTILYVSFPAYWRALPGRYSDVITISIAVN